MIWPFIVLIAIPLALWLAHRIRLAIERSRSRSRFLAKARAAGLEGSWKRGSLVVQRGARTITLEPMSRRSWWRLKDPPWTRWWIHVEPVAKEQRFGVYLQKRGVERYRHPKQRDHLTGDDAFDAAIQAYAFELDDPATNQRWANTTNRVLAHPEARETLRAIIVSDTDSVHLSGGGLRVSRPREGLSIADVLAQIELVTQLADAVEAAFMRSIYR
jgi:hypothetical protein